MRRFVVEMRAKLPIAIVDAYWDDRGRGALPDGDRHQPPHQPVGRHRAVPDHPVRDGDRPRRARRSTRRSTSRRSCAISARPAAQRHARLHRARAARPRARAGREARRARHDAAPARRMAELEAMTPRHSQHNPGHEIPEEHWVYRFAKKHWFFGFGAVHVRRRETQFRMRPARPEPAARRADAAGAAAASEHPADAGRARAPARDRRRYVDALPAWCRRCRRRAARAGRRVIARAGVDPVYRDYVGVLLNNEVWREHSGLGAVRAPAAAAAQVPARRRQVPGAVRRIRPALQAVRAVHDSGSAGGGRAARLRRARRRRVGARHGLIQTGKIDAIVGVSCLSVLERAFPYMEAAAIPGVAIPLLQDDCKDTTVDIDWVWDVIHLTSDDRTLPARPRRAPPRGARPGSRRRRSTRCSARPTARPSASRATGCAGRQALAAVPDRVRLQGAAGRSRRAAPDDAAKGRDRRRVLPQGVARSTTTSRTRDECATARRRCTSSTACRWR